MKLLLWARLRRLREMLRETSPTPEQLATRLRTVEKDVILPVKAVFVVILLYYLYFYSWFEGIRLPVSLALHVVERFFLIYLIVNIAVAVMLLRSKRFASVLVQRIIFFSNFLDSLFLAALTFVTDGFSSPLYWIFLGLIVRNAMSTPRAIPQIILNVSAILLYLLAGILGLYINDPNVQGATETEPSILRMFVMILMAACCYGLQVLFEKQRRAEEEAREFAARQEQLHSAGRLAAEIAHQIKNPLGIINNVAYSLQRAIQQGKSTPQEQVQIIRDEVERSDQILTKLMGYAQLAEGKVEKLKINEELDRAIRDVFPTAAAFDVSIETDYAPNLPVLMMQRGHLSEILVNVLQNAREALAGKGERISGILGLGVTREASAARREIKIGAQPGPDQSIVVTVSDNGPGISKPQMLKVFEPYFTTKEKGTGLGLSIVRHNVEMYGGTVSIESELGKGTTFIIDLPTRTFMKLQK